MIKLTSHWNIENVTYFLLIGDSGRQKVSLSSLYLKVYDDQFTNSSQPNQVKLVSGPLLNIPMMSATVEVKITKEGFFKTHQVYVLTVKSIAHNIGVKLMFDADKDESQFNAWQRCIEEAKDTNKCGINRLVEAKHRINYINVKKQKCMIERTKPNVPNKMYKPSNKK